MTKRNRFYQIGFFALAFAFITLCAYMGITAIQKTMNMKVGVNIIPSHEIRIDYGGETIFCNTTKDSAGVKVASGYTLNGNTLTFTQEFLSLGQTFALTIYNYNTSYLQVQVSGTGVSGNTIIISPYSEITSSEVLNLTISAGVNEAVLSFKKLVICSVSYSGENYTFSGTSSIMEGNSYSSTFSAPEYYNLPDAITITMSGQTLTSGYTYAKTSDTSATLTIDEVTGDVEVICEVTGDVVNVAINLYLNNNFYSNSILSIIYPSTNGTKSISRKSPPYGAGFSSYTFAITGGSGPGYNWNCDKSSMGLSVSVNATWGTVANEITIDIYGTSNS